ncbi:MAG: hypothetical protein RSD95_17155, partial [Clostridia bacterium]
FLSIIEVSLVGTFETDPDKSVNATREFICNQSRSSTYSHRSMRRRSLGQSSGSRHGVVALF